MKSPKHFAPFLIITLALSTSALARSKNEGTFTLDQTTRVGSAELQAGQYKAEWKEETGDSVKIDILQHGKTVTTVEGTLKEMPKPFAQDAVITKASSDNARTIEEIDFGNRKEALLIGE